MSETCPFDILKGATGDQLALKVISDFWTSGRVKGILAWARTGLDRLSPAPPIAVQLAHRREVLDVGSEEAWAVV